MITGGRSSGRHDGSPNSEGSFKEPRGGGPRVARPLSRASARTGSSLCVRKNLSLSGGGVNPFYSINVIEDVTHTKTNIVATAAVVGAVIGSMAGTAKAGTTPGTSSPAV